ANGSGRCQSSIGKTPIAWSGIPFVSILRVIPSSVIFTFEGGGITSHFDNSASLVASQPIIKKHNPEIQIEKIANCRLELILVFEGSFIFFLPGHTGPKIEFF